MKVIKAYETKDGERYFKAEDAAMHEMLDDFSVWYRQTENNLYQPHALTTAASAFPAANDMEVFKWLTENREFLLNMLLNIRNSIAETEVSGP